MKTLMKSFRHAWHGLFYAVREERNFQIELGLGVAAAILAFWLPLSPVERVIIFALGALVLSLELMNTAFERMLDMLKPHVHPYVKVIKDLVAGAVLIAALFALGIGLALFWPHLR